MTTTAKQLRNYLASTEIYVAPGIFDGLSARLVERAGFSLVYASGGAIARSSGIPDIGLLSLTEVVERVAHIVSVTSLPVIADADTGFGNEVNVARTVQLFERAGVAGFHLEDQTFPKRCGHLDDKTIISADEMALKIKVACASRKNADLVIIARTDAIAVTGFEDALERAKIYETAGADMLFVEAPQTIAQIEQIASHIKAPKLLNMFQGGKTPRIPLADLKAMGYRVVIIPSDLQRAAVFAMEKTLQAIKEHGDSDTVASQMVSFRDREELVQTANYLAIAKKSV